MVLYSLYLIDNLRRRIMKKGLQLSAATVLALSAVTPVAASAAETTTVTPGIYTTDAFVSIADFKKLSTTEKAALLGKADAILVTGKDVVATSLILTGTNDAIKAATVTVEQYQKDKNITIVPGKGISNNQGVELKVESVSAITETTVTVKLAEAPTKTLTVSDFKVTGAKVNSVTQGVTADVYVLNIDSLAGKQGSVTVNGVSKSYNFPAQVAKAAVENIKFENYRQFTVTYNTVVDTATATDPANYYLEIL